jgi:hypothetical protein
VGYFSPIGGSANPDSGTHLLDRHLRLVHDAFELRSDVKAMFGVPEDEAVRLVASGKRAELIDRIYASYAAYKDMHDVVLVQGTSLGSGKLDAEIAGALNAPAIIACQVRSGPGKWHLPTSQTITHGLGRSFCRSQHVQCCHGSKVALMECSSCAQRCRALALADGGWQRLATLLCLVRVRATKRRVCTVLAVRHKTTPQLAASCFPALLCRQRTCLSVRLCRRPHSRRSFCQSRRWVLLQQQAAALAGKGDTLVVCAPAEGACAQLWVLLQACGVWYARVGCVSLPNTAVYIVLQQCIRSARGVQQFAAYSSVHNLPACVPAGAHPWCGSQQGACKGSGNLHITAEAEVGTGLGLQHGSACTANKQHSAGVSLLHESLCCPLTPASAPSLCVMHRLSACKAERQQSW